MREWYRSSRFFSFAVLLAVLLVTGEGRLWPRDFEVFYRAALLFSPLALLPLDVAGVVYRIILIFVMLLGLWLAVRLVEGGPPRVSVCGADDCTDAGSSPDATATGSRAMAGGDAETANRTVLLSALALSLLFYSELTPGQVNQLIIVAGVAVALLVLPAAFYGGDVMQQNRSWLEALLEQVGGQGLLDPGNHTIFSFLALLTPLRWLPAETWAEAAYGACLLALLALAMLWLVRRGRDLDGGQALDFAALMLLAPLLVLASENVFGLAELAVVLLLFHVRERAPAERGVLAVGLALFWLGTLVNQVSGPLIDPLLAWVHLWSLISAGTLVLLALLFLDRYRRFL